QRDLARVLNWQGKFDEAAQLLSTYVAKRGDDKDALLDLARLKASQGDNDGALELLNRYRASGGDEETYLREAADLRTNPPAAVRAEMEKRWGDAEGMYREALKKEPNRADLLRRLADVLAVQNKRLEAAQALGHAADLQPE